MIVNRATTVVTITSPQYENKQPLRMHMFYRLRCGQRGYGDNSWFFFIFPLPSHLRDLTPCAHFIFYFFISPYCSSGSYRWLRALARAYDNHTLYAGIVNKEGSEKNGFRSAGVKGCYEVDIRMTSNLWFLNPRENVKIART